MKLFNKIKKHIFEKLQDFGLFSEVKYEYVRVVNMYDLYDKKKNTKDIELFASGLLSNKSFYSENKKEVLDKIYHDLNELNQCLIPLKNIGIDYNIRLIGGAVRDYVLDKHEQIKDLDIAIELSASSYWNSDRYYTEQEQNRKFTKENLQGFCTLEDLDKVNFNNDDNLYLKHNKLLQICLSRKTNTQNVNFFAYLNRVVARTGYGQNILQELSGIIKAKGGVFNYELDILITDKNMDSLIKTIDFNICNASIRIINTAEAGYSYFPPLSYLADRFFSSQQFFEDIMNKTVTFNVHKKTYEQIQHSLGDHRERIMKKYPDYTLQVSGKHIGEREQELIEKMMLHHELEQTVVSQENPIKNKRIKL